jgi:hypothetical protein
MSDIAFQVDGRRFAVNEATGLFRIQIGRTDKSGRIRYLPKYTFRPYVLQSCFRYFEGYNMGPAYVKRLTYKASEYDNWYELAKVKG